MFYMQVVLDSMMCGIVWSKPDLAHEVSVISKFMANLGKTH